MLWQMLLPLSSAFAATQPAHGEQGGQHAACSAMEHSAHSADNAYSVPSADRQMPVDHGSHHRTHCALCFLQGGTPALYDARNPLVVVAIGAYVLPEAVLPRTHSIQFSAPPPSRAPPFYS
jgi:hypothetical protein